MKYVNARLVEGATRWYVLYYQTHPSTGKLERFRETFDLNRIANLKKRRKEGKKHVKSSIRNYQMAFLSVIRSENFQLILLFWRRLKLRNN